MLSHCLRDTNWGWSPMLLGKVEKRKKISQSDWGTWKRECCFVVPSKQLNGKHLRKLHRQWGLKTQKGIKAISKYTLCALPPTFKIILFIYRLLHMFNISVLNIFRANRTWYIHTWSEFLVPLVNMIKEGCENKCTLLILLIFYFF